MQFLYRILLTLVFHQHMYSANMGTHILVKTINVVNESNICLLFYVCGIYWLRLGNHYFLQECTGLVDAKFQHCYHTQICLTNSIIKYSLRFTALIIIEVIQQSRMPKTTVGHMTEYRVRTHLKPGLCLDST